MQLNHNSRNIQEKMKGKLLLKELVRNPIKGEW
jgi:hypothetical protein